MLDVLKEKLKNLPSDSGVYLMKNANGNIIYVGKAKNLKNRVRQYFQNNNNKGVKVELMVSKITDLEYIITPDEINALVLENILIKKYKPHFNILLKDDKQYPYIKINLQTDFPKLEIARKFVKGEKSKYFGPYMQGVSIGEVLDTVNGIFNLRTCKNSFERKSKIKRACLNFHIGKCSAPCDGHISKEVYNENLENAIDFLQGNNSKAKSIVKNKMLEASEREDYEQALFYRGKLEILTKLERKQVVALPQNVNYDIFSIASDSENRGIVSISLLIIRNGKIHGADTECLTIAENIEEALSRYIISYFHKNQSNAHEILTNISLADKDIIIQYLFNLYGTKIKINCPQRGIRRNLTEMAQKNAENSLASFINNSERKRKLAIDSLNELSLALNIQDLHRIECFDNSHISGSNYVSSMVVFIEGETKNSHYRRFKIKTFEGNNDYNAMYEILKRRLTRLIESKKYQENSQKDVIKSYNLQNDNTKIYIQNAENSTNIINEDKKNATKNSHKANDNKDEFDVSYSQTPSLIILDGGKGQLSVGLEVLKELNLNINIVALAEREELLYIPNNSEPIYLPYNGNAFTLLQRIRDEAHRFAITFHRSLREKKITESTLLKIDGVGKNRIVRILTHFKTMDNIKNASIENLAKIKGINKDVATKIYEYFHKI